MDGLVNLEDRHLAQLLSQAFRKGFIAIVNNPFDETMQGFLPGKVRKLRAREIFVQYRKTRADQY